VDLDDMNVCRPRVPVWRLAVAVAAALLLGAPLASAAIRSDEFNGTTLDTSVWTFVNPLGDASVSMNGSQASIGVPGLVSHDVWTNGVRAPQLRQAVSNDDFEVEVKFDSSVDAAYQIQGILVQQDVDDLLRLEFHYDGRNTKLFAAALSGSNARTHHYGTVQGGAPAYMRVLRSGNSWTIRHSRDGRNWTTATTFTHAMTVTSMGPFAGNSGNIAPSFTSAIDYFREVRPDDVPPVIGNVTSTPGTIAARLTWTTDEPASSRVSYGTDTTYADATVSSNDLVTAHSVLVHGLSCGQTYHFQPRSVDEAGNAQTGPDRTFTTNACEPRLVSDEFDGAGLDASIWTLVDPVGDAGVSTQDGRARVALPGGISHDIWTDANRAPRLLQAAPDENFEVEVKFASAVAGQYQLQGLVVEQDADDLLRLEVHHDGNGTRLFAGSLVDGTASVKHDSILPSGTPVYLRLKRVGDQWTLSYGTDGDTWTRTITITRAMRVAAVGPFVGNSGSAPPAFQGEIDYFHYIPPDRTPPVISGVTAEPGTGSTARVSWTTDERSSSEVAFGKTTAYGDVISGAGETRTHSALLHGLACASTYHLQVRSTDAAGNTANSPDATVATPPCPDVIASDEFDGTALESGRWAFVDPLGDSSQSVGGGQATLRVPAGAAHDLWSTARTAPRLLQAVPDESFEVEVKFNASVAAQYQMQGLVVEQSHDTLLRIETHWEGSTRKLFVAALAGSSATVLHSSTLTGDPPAYLRLRRAGDQWTLMRSVDGEIWTTATTFTRALAVAAIGPFVGNAGSPPPAYEGRVDYFREITDRIPPGLSAIEARPRSRSAVFTWTTDEPAGSTVEHALGGGPWTQAGSTKLETRHLVTVPDLACDTAYRYRVRSADSLGNEAVSSERTLRTAPCTPTGGPDIEVWGGDDQDFGAVGIPQTWINVMGNVSDPEGVASITASLNGGPAEQLGLGPDNWRLERSGDFNVELSQAELVPGENSVALRAVDAAGNVSVHTVKLNWEGLGAGPAPSSSGPVLVVVAHPDDESLGMAGIIRQAQTAGRRVVVAVVSNGEGSSTAEATGECNAPGDREQRAAAHGLLRNGEGRDAMGVLGLTWSANAAQSGLIYLGYTGQRLPDIARAESPLTDDTTGLHRTYADEFDGNVATCNGDLRYRLTGQHSNLSAAAMAADFDALFNLVAPSDVYTHTHFDGHLDHAEVYKQVVATVRRGDRRTRVHTTLIHPEGDANCMGLSSARWPNPALQNNDPFARFTPWLDVTAPPAAPCDAGSGETRWGPFGAPNELVEVPASMQATTEGANLKWRAIAEHESQIDCSNPDQYHVNCGYMRAFVKRHEFFWQYDYRGQRIWPKTYTAHWTSDASIPQHAQVLEGEWRFEGNGVRPLSTGFDRGLLLGDIGWTDYEVTVPVTLHSVDGSKPDAGVGIGVGWQGHTGGSRPRVGHPTGGLCLYARAAPEPSPLRLALGYSPGPVHDTTVATRELTLAPGVRYMFRFRQQGLASGSTRYSCKVWPADEAEPVAWTLSADIPHWSGTTTQRAGSAVLLAHQVDATFGDATVAPAGN
jgi:LmbE family N-acetylglucosaminyl deacetylase/regulation of enolase protein 1 (concanavalin A-like superfamily)